MLKTSKFTRKDVDNFFKENDFLSQYSGRRRHVAKRSRPQYYRRIFSSSEILNSFEIDLFYVMENKKLIYYFFVALDLTSKYLIFTRLKHRSKTNIVYGLTKILKQVKDYRQAILNSNNPDEKLIFFSDKGKGGWQNLFGFFIRLFLLRPGPRPPPPLPLSRPV